MQTISQSPTDPAFVENPYPFYERARALGDIVFWEDYRMPVAFGHQAVNEVLRDQRLGRERPADQPRHVPAHLKPFYKIEDGSMLEAEPPRHTRLRRSMVGVFTAARVQALSTTVSTFVDAFANDLPTGPFDIIDALAGQLPLRIITRLLGLPDDRAADLLAWSHAMVVMYQARRNASAEVAAAEAAQAFGDYIREIVRARRSKPGDDILSALTRRLEQGELTEDELVSTAILMLNAGHEATVHTLGNALYLYLTGKIPPDAMLPSAIAGTVEEILRYEPPLHLFTRYVYEDVNVLGYELAKGTEIGACLAAANRDPKVWPAPQAFDPTRPTSPHLSFGAGIHFCLGAALARLELQVALPMLTSRLPRLRLAEEPRFANLYHFRGLEKLVVTCD